MALDPSMGLGQGNGAAPPGFLAVCTLMINIYHNLSHRVMFIGAWAWDAFTLSTVLYINASDLFHMAIGTPLDEEFLQLIQTATNNWAGLVHTTRRLLKPQKCFWYMLGWVWKKGKENLKTLYELPQDPLYIPQPDSTRVPIHLKAISDPENKLGVHTCLTGDFSHHVAHILTMESEYAESLGETSGKGCLDGYALLTILKTYLWSCCNYSLTTETGGCIQIYLVQTVTLRLCQ
jgi:hypothetical protein